MPHNVLFYLFVKKCLSWMCFVANKSLSVYCPGNRMVLTNGPLLGTFNFRNSSYISDISELLTWMGRAMAIFFLPRPLGPWGGVKYHLISITKSISRIFIPNFECVLTNERCKTYQTGFSFYCLGHVPEVGLWGTGGAQVVKNLFFSNMVILAYQIDGDDQQNRMQVKFSP